MDPKPTLLYYFSHRALRDFVQDNFVFFDSVVRLGPQIFEKTLRQSFETMKRFNLAEVDITATETDFTTSIARINENKDSLLLIKLPEPRNTTEVSFIGITLAGNVRYFTLELHIPNDLEKQVNPDAQTKYVLGEWVKKEHRLLNQSLSEPDPAKLSGAIEKVLTSPN